jgi:hypothetical protein
MATSQSGASSIDPSTRGAVRFFWMWLIVATAASIAGNVVHAILNAPKESTALAAAAAVVPPAVLLGSTHSVALLVRARRTGAAYWCALLMTFALAGCAFVLSFAALSDLATSLGMPADRAWLWPCAIDLSIAQSTLALLSLNAPVRTIADGRTVTSAAVTTAPVRPSPTIDQSESRAVLDDSADGDGLGSVPSASTSDAGAPPAAVARWQPTAHKLVRSGVTQKDPMIVAQILAEHEAGTPPSMIGRRLQIHHTTVARILTEASDPAG